MSEKFKKLVHIIEKPGSLFALLTEWLNAYKARTEAWKGSGEGSATPANPDIDLIKQELSIVHGMIFDLTGKVDSMSTNIDRIEKEAADLAADVPVIKQALEDLKTLVSDLKAQLAQGALDQARLDAAAASLEKVDDDLDTLTTPPTPLAPVEG